MCKIRNRFIPLLMIVILLLSCIPDVAFAAESDNSNLLISHAAYVTGYDDGTVRPEENITRAETATLIFRLLGSNIRTICWSTTNNFNDVSSIDWYNNAVSTLLNAEIIKGYSDGTFKGNNRITRAEFVTMIYRFDGISYIDADKFPDIKNHWAAKYINVVADKGWITGYKDGTFKPEQHITRAEAIIIINRAIQCDKISADDMLDDMITWSDNKPGTWYYEAVQEATNSHDPAFRADGTEYWTKLNEVPDWTKLEKQGATVF